MKTLEINKIYCIDCLEGMDELEDDSIDLILTDPPFNVGIDYKGYEDNIHDIRYYKWCKEWVNKLYPLIKKGKYSIIFTGDKKCYWIFRAIYESPFLFHHFLKWYKPGCQESMPGTILFGRTELAFILSREKPNTKLINRKVLFADTLRHRNTRPDDQDAVEHDCRCPTGLYEQIIKGFTKEGEVVLDIFSGSGTTAIACKRLNRNFIGFEINPKYVKIVNERLQRTLAYKSLRRCI